MLLFLCLQKVEEKERNDAKMSGGDGDKKAGKKMFGSKMPKKELKETQPSEDAIRIEPIIDSDMRKRLITTEKKPRVCLHTSNYLI